LAIKEHIPAPINPKPRLIKIKKAFHPKTSGIHEKIIGIL